jgi:ribonuclease HI
MDKFALLTGQRSILSYFQDPELQTKSSSAAVAAAVPPVTAAAVVAPRPIVGSAGTAGAAAADFAIFCDGACTRNGRKGARAGYGVSTRKNGIEVSAISEPLNADEQQTNQRAELRALQCAIGIATDVADTATSVRIYSDSEYAINCITRWGPGWRRAMWKKADGGPVLHRDIIEPLLHAWELVRGTAVLQHVAAHTGRRDTLSLGNARADELATASLGSLG